MPRTSGSQGRATRFARDDAGGLREGLVGLFVMVLIVIGGAVGLEYGLRARAPAAPSDSALTVTNLGAQVACDSAGPGLTHLLVTIGWSDPTPLDMNDLTLRLVRNGTSGTFRLGPSAAPSVYTSPTDTLGRGGSSILTVPLKESQFVIRQNETVGLDLRLPLGGHESVLFAVPVLTCTSGSLRLY